MNRKSLSLIAAACLFAGGVNAEDAVPAKRSLENYQQMRTTSPFALATAAVKEEQPPFTQNLYITGIGTIGDKACVYVASRDGQTRYALAKGETSPDGMTVEDVEWSKDVGRTRVKVRKGSEVGALEFDQATISKAPAAPQAAPTPGQNERVPSPRGWGNRRGNFGNAGAGTPGAPAPPPGAERANPPGQGPPTGETRRRIRVIPNR